LTVPRPIPTDELNEIENAVRAHPGITSAEIGDVLGEQVPRRTLQFRLKRLVDDGRVLREGEGRWARYSAPGAARAPAQPEAAADEAAVRLSPESQEIRVYLRQPLAARKPVGYNREFLNAYRPGETFYLPQGARARLA
jgi:DNA-binding transcriptional ArsR family regulator